MRKAMSLILAGALCLTLCTGALAVSGFSDVPEGKWYTAEIREMTAAGYIDGYEDGTFRPDGDVSVAEFVTIVARCLGLETGAENSRWAGRQMANAYDKGWLDEQEMLDMTALAQSSPGPIALNAAIQVGWRVGGAVGMVIATIATILPPMIILTVISIFYSAFANNEYVALVLKGMQAGVAAVIADVVCDLGGKVLKTKSWIHIALMLAAFIATYFLNINVIFVILASALIGVILSLIDRRKGAKKCD